MGLLTSKVSRSSTSYHGRVSDKAAGWYPDPSGQNRQRYWDGDSWTDYYTPLPPPTHEIHGAATATEDYPYLAAASHHDVMVKPVTAPPANGWPTVSPAAGTDDGGTVEFSGAGTRSNAARWAVVAAVILVVMLVGGLAWWAIVGPSEEASPTADDTPSVAPGDGETLTGEIAADTPVDAEVREGGAWVGTFEVVEESTYLIDVTSSDGTDLHVAVQDEGASSPIGENDDRGSQLAYLGDNALDPLLAVTLTPGTYEVVVTEHEAEASSFTVTAATVTEQVELDTPAVVSAPADGRWTGTVEIPTAGDITIEVTSDGSVDPVLIALGPDGEQLVNDDRSPSDFDPLLTHTVADGTWVLIVADYYGDTMTADLTVRAS